MLKSLGVSRQGPRSMATTSNPASVSCWARIEPVQPSPTITTSFLARVRANSALDPVDGDRSFGIRHVVLVDVIAIIVTRARKAQHLPARHATIAAVERVGEATFHGVLQHQ